MGGRGNIKFVNSGVYLYTHWRGYDIQDIVRAALAKEERWDDEAYLTRIVFDEMTKGDEGTTGYGISTEVQDNEYPILIIDCDKQEISFEGSDEDAQSFDDFIKGKVPGEE